MCFAECITVLVVGDKDDLYYTESVDSVCRDGMDMPYVVIQTEAWKTLAKNTVICFYRYLTFIIECSVLNKTLKFAGNYHGSTKLAGCKPT